MDLELQIQLLLPDGFEDQERLEFSLLNISMRYLQLKALE
jgi:hypothetical protein